MTYEIDPKSSKKFCCIHCDYTTSRESQYARHLLTSKHLNTYTMFTNTCNLVPTNNCEKIYECNCGRSYKHRQSLYSHKKKCELVLDDVNKSIDDTPALMDNNSIKSE